MLLENINQFIFKSPKNLEAFCSENKQNKMY